MTMFIIVSLVIIAAILFVGFYFRMLKQMLLMLVCVIIVLAIIGYHKYEGFQQFAAMKDGMAHAKQTISTGKAARDEWRSDLSAVGSLRAVKGVDISNELVGTVEEIDFTSGGDTQEGTVLLKMRAEDDIAKLASLEAASKLAEINYNRDKKQLAVQAVSQATVDSDFATLAGARALAAEQKAIVDKKTIRAPFDGHLGIRNVDVGQYLNAGTAIVTLQQLDPIYLDFNMPEQTLAQIKTGQKISVQNDTYPGRKFEGTITAINPKVDLTTRNVAVRAQLANADHALLPGMYATAKISVGEPQNFVTVPQTAITYNPYGDAVYIVVEKGKDDSGKPQLQVEQSFVTLGETRGDQVQVLKGLKEGDEVVTSGQLKLQNGASVIVDNTVTPKDDPNPKPQEQ